VGGMPTVNTVMFSEMPTTVIYCAGKFSIFEVIGDTFSLYTSFLIITSSLCTHQENIFAWNSEIYSVFEHEGREAA